MSDLVRELSESLAAGEFGDCREILDEMIDLCVVDSDFPQGEVDLILATRQDVKFSFCSVDGWSYDEFDENGV
ncbi:MAG: hypothetical protein ACRDCE_09455, partial [Cetobacterium sp.]|uniref:hypothetical protein n=1 Tax=Cetobacterium sp. TaxID=2071632 RepID=UPI003EE4D8FE